nr:unnamed protein product [uncultured bacterium]
MSLGSIVGAIGGLIGGHNDREFARAQSAADRAFQKEVFQNQYQWKAADAKKAGLHPLAVIGGGSYSASPSSQPSSSSMADSLGKLGEGIGDAAVAYMSKDAAAEQAAKADKRADEQHDANMRESAARTLMYNGQALEATRRAASYSVPMANGREVMKGQTDSNGPFYAIRHLGNGQYDINLTTDHQQELGDELGQIYNFVRKGSREGGLFEGIKYHFSGGRFGSRYGNIWTDPATKQKYRFDRESGYWEKVR